MSYSRENYRRAKQILTQRRNAAIAESKRRLDELHGAHPDIASIDSALAKTGMSLVEQICAGPDGIKQRIAQVRTENERLQADREDMLKYYGYPPDYTDVKYTCPLCGDTGYNGTEPCTCMKRLLSRLSLESSGLARLADKMSFDNFSLSFYTGADLENARKIYIFCKDYASRFTTSSDSLLLVGATGLGKTHLSTSIAVAVIDKGYDVFYSGAANIFSALEAEKFGRVPAFPTAVIFDCELLIIDDLGIENPGNLSANFLYNIVNTRLSSGLPTIINTNLQTEEIRRRYSDRISSRLMGEYTLLPLSGKDIRMQKLTMRS